MPTNEEFLNSVLESPKLDECISILNDLVDSDEEEVSWHFIRAQKVLLVVKKAIKHIDPDLIPNKNLSTINTHISTIHNIVNLPHPAQNLSGNHAANFHNAIEALVITLFPFVADGGLRDQAHAEAQAEIFKTQKEKIKSLLKEAKELREKIDGEYESVGATAKEIEEIKERVDDYDTEVFGDDNTEGLRSELQRKLEEIDVIYDKITVFDDKFHNGTEEENGIRQRIVNARDEAESDRNAIKDHLTDALDNLRELGSYYESVFGSEDENGNKKSKGLKEEIRERLDSIQDYHEKKKQIHTTLEEKIKELHEGAINAGLATAYNKLKTSFDKPIKTASWTFMGTMVAILGLSLFFFFKSDADLANATELLYATLARIPFYLPLIWLAVFTSKRRSEYNRLQQEYAHKEALAISFESYKKQIAELGEDSDQLSKLLLASAIETIAYNASETLDKPHGDKHPVQETVNGVSNGLSNIMSRSKGTE